MQRSGVKVFVKMKATLEAAAVAVSLSEIPTDALLGLGGAEQGLQTLTRNTAS
jgi:hypothetical protein